MIRHIGTYLAVFAIFAVICTIVFEIKVFFGFGLTLICCMLTSAVTATILIKKEIEFKGVFGEIFIFLIISTFLLITTYYNYKLNYIITPKIYAQAYYVYGFYRSICY